MIEAAAGALRRDPLGLVPPAAAALVLALLFFAWPRAAFPPDLATAVYDRRGFLLGASVSSDGMWRFPPGAALSPKFVEALTCFEDRRFFYHPGFDSAALIRALGQNLKAGRRVSGGSTLSMQVARIARYGHERSVGEKLAELWMALRLEFLHGKRGVLELYARNAPFGGNVVGIEAASFRYFGRSPELLSWAEAATLAVLPNAPSMAHPGKNRDRLLAKRDRLLRSLRERGSISGADLELALAEPLGEGLCDMPRTAPQLVARYASAREGGGEGASRVETTIDAGLQDRVADITERRRQRLAAGGVRNLACIVARIDSGEVLAYVANSSSESADGASPGSLVDLIRAPRSSGSLFKPFLYAAALEAGELGPRSLLPDLPTRYGSYEPENYTGSWSGAIRADEALARSLNVPFVRLLRSFGIERFHAILASTGMRTLGRPPEDYGLALILGGAETSLWDMAGRYAALARSSEGPGPRQGLQRFDLALTRAEAAAVPYRNDPFSRGSAALTLDALTRVARPEEEAAWADYASSRRIAWKTGTSFGNRDAWAIGVDGNFVVGVWAGNASGEGRPSLRGSASAAPLLFEVFSFLSASGSRGLAEPGQSGEKLANAGGGTSAAALDSAFRQVEVCADSGWAAGPDCPRTELALVPKASVALPLCPYCRRVALSADGAWRVRAEDEAPGSVRVERRFVLTPAMELYYRRGHLDYRPLPPWRRGALRGEADGGLDLVQPERGASIYIPIELSGKPGATIFVAADRERRATVFWQLDGNYLGSTKGEHRIESRPGPGPHSLTVVDDSGRSVTRSFTVLSEK